MEQIAKDDEWEEVSETDSEGSMQSIEEEVKEEIIK